MSESLVPRTKSIHLSLSGRSTQRQHLPSVTSSTDMMIPSRMMAGSNNDPMVQKGSHLCISLEG